MIWLFAFLASQTLIGFFAWTLCRAAARGDQTIDEENA